MAKFNEVRKGYDKEQVDAYITTIATEYETLTKEYKKLEAKCKAEKNDTSYSEAIAAALVNAELSGKKIIAGAQTEAERIVLVANREVEEISNRKEGAIEEVRQLVERLGSLFDEESN